MEKVVIVLVIALCGASANTNATSRIFNGVEATINQFPYSVSLQQATPLLLQQVHRGHRCGGVLISYSHVLTAASCLFNVVNGIPVQITSSEYRVFAGATLLTDDNDINRIRTIANITVHPQYVQAPASLNNIAILTLSSPFPNTTVIPIAVPASNFDPADSTVCTIAGWGSLNASATAAYNLRYANKIVYNQDLCATVYNQLPTLTFLNSTMICTAPFNVVTSGCNGDDGSALVCNGNLTGILFQTNGCSVTVVPEVYTRVSNYTTWIRSVTGASSTFRPELTIFAILAIIAAKFLH